MKIENITELFKTVMDDFNAENIILQGISLNENYEKIFEEFCKKYFPHRLNDDYKTIEYYSFFHLHLRVKLHMKRMEYLLEPIRIFQ